LSTGLAARLRRSTALRFVALYVALNFAAALPIFLYVYHTTDRLLLSEFQARVTDEAAVLRAEHQAGGVIAVERGIRERLSAGGSGDALLLVDPAGKPVAGNVAAWPPVVRKEGSWIEMALYRQGHARAEPIGFVALRLPDGYRLLIGQVLEDRQQLRDALVKALAGALLLGLPLGLAGSAVLLRFLNRRVRGIAAIAAHVASGELRHRIDTGGGTTDPFDALAMSLNAMLERLEQLVEELRFVTDSLAHDLRSPLTRMRGAVDSALREDDPSARHAALEAVSREIQTMLSMLNATLEVSRAEAGIGRESFERFDMAALARDLAEMYAPLAEEGEVVLEIHAPPHLFFVGNRELIAQALSNLIDNALKYGASGRSIVIGLERAPGELQLSVADRGPGIPREERETALLKYRRLDHARSTMGSGLGLSLVGAVARLHGGRIVLEDNRPGLRALLALPDSAGEGKVTEPS
jgi:signal transduction histidine kinase